MSNPTILVENFSGSLGAFAGVAPIRVRSDGAMFEQAGTNLITKPMAVDLFAFGHLTLTTLTGQSVTHPVSGGNADRYRRATITGTAGSDGMLGVSAALPTPPASSVAYFQVLARFSASRIGDSFDIVISEQGGAAASRYVLFGSAIVTGDWQVLSANITLAQADRNLMVLQANAPIVDQDIGSTFDVTFADAKIGNALTTSIPEVDSSGAPLAGYAFTGTAHSSTSTRAASSASVTIAEPAAVACWYREGYSGAKTFAYLEPYGTLGTYGSIAYAAGDLTISTSRNLVIGPFAAFDRELTANEQANLRSTQNWSMNSVNGSNIILPLSSRRRPR